MTVAVLYRRDFGLRLCVSLILSLFFLFLGSDSIGDIVNGRYFAADFIASFLLVFITTSYISLLSAYFDREYPWTSQAPARIVYQLIAGILVPSAFVLGYMYVYLIVILGFERSEVPFFHTEFPISVLFIIFWNLLYTGYYFYHESRKSKEELDSLRAKLFTLQDIKTNGAGKQGVVDNGTGDEDGEMPASANRIRTLVAVSGNRNIPIPVEHIAYFSKKGNYTSMTTFQSESYLLNHSLDELVKHLSSSLFFRANRQFIINIKACHYFTNEENGKLALHLTPAFDGEVTISQKRSAAFRDWLNQVF
jgi:hypothetical protein